MICYEYYCEDPHCRYVFEESRKVSQRDFPTVLACPKCGEYTVNRSVGCGTFILKGSCWSRDNYATYVGDDPRWSPEKGYGGVPSDKV